MTEHEWLSSTSPRDMFRHIEDRMTLEQRDAFVWACRHASGVKYDFEPQDVVGFWMEIIEGTISAAEVPVTNRCHFLRDIIGNPCRPQPYYEDGHIWEELPRTEGGKREWVRVPWWTDNVRQLADAAWESGGNGELDPQALLVLRDALLDYMEPTHEIAKHLEGMERCAECLGSGEVTDDSGGNIGVIKHCYSCHGNGWIAARGPHVRGCWVVELLRSKS